MRRAGRDAWRTRPWQGRWCEEGVGQLEGATTQGGRREGGGTVGLGDGARARAQGGQREGGGQMGWGEGSRARARGRRRGGGDQVGEASTRGEWGGDVMEHGSGAMGHGGGANQYFLLNSQR